MPDLTLDDISTDRWTQVARRVRRTPDDDDWAYHMEDPERDALLIAQQHGSVIIMNDRDETGRQVLVARRVRKPSGPERFAVAGRNLFR